VTKILLGQSFTSDAQIYETDDVSLWRDGDVLAMDIDGPRIDELRTLLSRGLNTWERAPEWLLKLSEIVDKP
jgi:hypothetical protein